MMVGSKGSVTLDSRFDAGYFCTVKVGRHEFKGTQRLAYLLYVYTFFKMTFSNCNGRVSVISFCME